MELSAETLEHSIRARQLPEAVVIIALRGGAAAHPALGDAAEYISLTDDDPTSAVIAISGRSDLVPLWMTSATTTVFSAADGTFVQWNAEDEDGPWEQWPDFASTVRFLLTDLYEGMVSDTELHEVASLLLPADQVAAALVPEER